MNEDSRKDMGTVPWTKTGTVPWDRKGDCPHGKSPKKAALPVIERESSCYDCSAKRSRQKRSTVFRKRKRAVSCGEAAMAAVAEART